MPWLVACACNGFEVGARHDVRAVHVMVCSMCMSCLVGMVHVMCMVVIMCMPWLVECACLGF